MWGGKIFPENIIFFRKISGGNFAEKFPIFFQQYNC